jgi:hypothetical protein
MAETLVETLAGSAAALADDPVAGLIGIPLPVPVSLWPATWTARISIAVLAVGLVAAIVWLARWWYVNRYRRAALADLDRILRAPAVGLDAASIADALALLVRRTALAAFPRQTVAPLAGPAWLAFLDRSYGGHEFSQGAGSPLSLAPYDHRPMSSAEVASLADLVRRWIRRHHA